VPVFSKPRAVSPQLQHQVSHHAVADAAQAVRISADDFQVKASMIKTMRILSVFDLKGVRIVAQIGVHNNDLAVMNMPLGASGIFGQQPTIHC